MKYFDEKLCCIFFSSSHSRMKTYYFSYNAKCMRFRNIFNLFECKIIENCCDASYIHISKTHWASFLAYSHKCSVRSHQIWNQLTYIAPRRLYIYALLIGNVADKVFFIKNVFRHFVIFFSIREKSHFLFTQNK